jgi:hypothetical protein
VEGSLEIMEDDLEIMEDDLEMPRKHPKIPTIEFAWKIGKLYKNKQLSIEKNLKSK